MSFRWLSVLVFLVAAAAQTPNLGGDYSGMLGALHLKLHLKLSANGAMQGTLDSLDQGAMGLPCANFHVEEKALSFDVPSVGGKWHGTISEDGATLNGSWSQGAEMPLVFRRELFAPAQKPSRVDGIWLGTLAAGGSTLRVQVQVKSAAQVRNIVRSTAWIKAPWDFLATTYSSKRIIFSFEVPAVKGHWSGTLAENGNELDGAWSQGQDMPLKLTRQTVALAPKAPEPPKYDAALAAVPVSELKAVLDRDLAAALKNGALAPATGGGVVIGVVQRGTRRIFAYGSVEEDSIFEIGSITKTFTGLMLAQMVAQQKVKLDEPVRELLPPGTVAKPAGAEITLLDLATQQSGLPRMPDNFHPADEADPYADYRPANLYEFISKHGVSKPASTGFNYSNLGLGLLGQALANRAGMTYPELLRAEITGPLEMHDTVVKLSPEQEKRFAQGHTAKHQQRTPGIWTRLPGRARFAPQPAIC